MINKTDEPIHELSAEAHQLLTIMQQRHGAEKTAGALLAVAMMTIQELYGTEFLMHYYRALLDRLPPKNQVLQ